MNDSTCNQKRKLQLILIQSGRDNYTAKEEKEIEEDLGNSTCTVEKAKV